MKGNKKTKKGFTLIELLVVIAIIAILSVVVILTLNPAELLRESRDSNRVSDLSVMKSAMGFYLSVAPIPVVTTTTSAGVCYVDAQGTNGTTTCATWFHSFGTTVSSVTPTAARDIDGTGWIPVNFSTSTISAGAPISALPIDPLNTGGVYFYSYIASSSNLTYKLDAHMESSKYGFGGSNDVVSTDGGVDNGSYEVGTLSL